jgi:ribosome modulation factor
MKNQFKTDVHVLSGTIVVQYGSETCFNQNSRQQLTFEDAQRLLETLAEYDFPQLIEERDRKRAAHDEWERTHTVTNAKLIAMGLREEEKVAWVTIRNREDGQTAVVPVDVVNEICVGKSVTSEKVLYLNAPTWQKIVTLHQRKAVAADRKAQAEEAKADAINKEAFEAEKAQRMSAARIEGYEAYWKGNGMDANPYDRSDVERAEWQIGWDKAREVVATNNDGGAR